MRLTVNTLLSMDGVMQGPGGADEDPSNGFDRGGWLVPLAGEEMDQIVSGWFRQADALLLGRTTYEILQPYWEMVTDPCDEVADSLNHLPKYLVSSTLAEPSWHNTRVLDGDPVEAVARIKKHERGELQMHGSHQLAQALYEAGLVDEYRLLIFPVVVGAGKRLFQDSVPPSSFIVAGTHVTKSGLVALSLLPRPFRAAF
ncbi:dihydrofolate reductase family protein [Arthrobacter koreensis]|uniref:Dihydrofolate reductase family protein n=1 Tax=Arthrobacter koreensis TaxID=199136 RepID=A0ABY6FRG5_9MICC|nr:dihydrofolate reductase family protein [Arthrobacter koreensis]MDF2498389.1 deaminase [Arthrobacter koreensis]MEB7446705.1 dihydrofolate reductase family protein [Arthrobacter koreensis]UYB35772.1 dihydrofolate reductase family protein [Arthrobacter koreensis]